MKAGLFHLRKYKWQNQDYNRKPVVFYQIILEHTLSKKILGQIG